MKDLVVRLNVSHTNRACREKVFWSRQCMTKGNAFAYPYVRSDKDCLRILEQEAQRVFVPVFSGSFEEEKEEGKKDGQETHSTPQSIQKRVAKPRNAIQQNYIEEEASHVGYGAGVISKQRRQV